MVALDGGSGATLWSRSLAATSGYAGNALPCDIVYGSTTAADGTTGVPALFVNARTTIYALDPADGTTISSYALPAPPTSNNAVTSALAYGAGQLYFGDYQGALRVIDATTLAAVTQTTDTVATQNGVLGQPALIADADTAGAVVVLFTRGDQGVWLFDPGSGTLEQIATDLTAPGSLAYDNTHGLLYAMGWNYGSGSDLIGQVFALQPDSAIQAERAFIIESQLMQDYGSDTEAAGTGVARYQTHVSIVDSTNAAQPNVSIKLWADADATAVTIDGTAVTIGPDTPALFTTDGTGTCIILSDAGDLTTITLRLWAAFMEASERITIVPDAEFHQRLAAATASSATDPRQIDMVSATTYDGTQLFSSSDQSQAQQAQQACTGLLGSVGVGAAASAQYRHTAGGTVWLTQTPTPPKYTVYTALPGMAYSAINAGANLALNVANPVGLSLTASGYNAALKPGQAAALIDALEGAAPTGALLGSVFSDLKHAWDEIKQTAATVTQVIVSVAKEVYVGIQYVVNGVTTVVKAIAHDVVDALATIGSLFVQLGKVLADVVEALSMLLHLDEIFKTATIIRTQFATAMSNLATTLASGKQTCDTFFSNTEANITSAFCQLFALMDLPTAPGCPPTVVAAAAGTPLSGVNGMGATPTTVYNTGQGGTSQAVPCGWSNHVLRTNMYNGSTPTSLGAAPDFESIMSGFFDSLKSNTQLAQAYSDVGSTFHATFKATSVKDFFEMVLEDLLEIVKALLITGVAIVQALIDTLLSPTNLPAVVGEVQNLGAIHIPILSTLWKRLTGNELTFLDLFTLVLAFPVTFMYRAFAGTYPSASSGVQSPQVRSSLLGGMVPTEPAMVKNVLGLVAAGAMLTRGWINGFLDSVYVIGGPEGNGVRDYGFGYLGKINTVIALVQSIGSLGWGQVDAPPSTQTHEIVMGLVSFLRICNGVFVSNDTQGDGKVIASYLGSLLSAFSAIEAGTHYVSTDAANKLVLARSVLGQVAGFVNPVKTWGTAEELYPFIPAGADAAFGEATAGLMAAQVLENMLNGANDVGVYRRHLPRIHNGG